MRSVDVVLFDGFGLLDVFGPVALFSRLADQYRIRFTSPMAGPVRSSQGVEVIAEHDLAGPSPDLVLVSGGIGTRALVHERDFLDSLRRSAVREHHLLRVHGIGAPGCGRDVHAHAAWVPFAKPQA